MDKCELFKIISQSVWEIICRNHVRSNRLNEEGLTRQTILDMIQNHVEDNQTFNVFAQKAIDEVNTGGDLEIYIDNGNQKFYRILLQAKLMELSFRFEHLNRYSGSTGRRQYNTLKDFARKVNCDAYYLMYNGCPDYKVLDSDCAGDYNEKQFGCAIMTPDEIKDHCENNSTGILGTTDNPKPFGKPWRILTCCDYSYINGNKLYSLDEIDMDDYFEKLFTKINLTSFITSEQFRNQQMIEENNNLLHEEGWNPLARIIISENGMKKNSDNLLEL